MNDTHTEDTLATARWAVDNANTCSALWGLAMARGYLAELPSFQAYCELPELGPRNDWDGTRSTALSIKREIEEKILPAAYRNRDKFIAQDSATANR